MRSGRGDARFDGKPFDVVLAAARQRDRRAFERLFELLNRRVHAFARTRGGTDPEGVVNEVFLQVFTGLGNFEGTEAQFNAWVFRIARNKLIDESRRRERRPTEVLDEGADTERVAAHDDVEAQVIGAIGTEAMLAVLDVLTEEQRDVVLLRVVADLTVETVAGILGTSPGAVKALQRRAFRHLAKEFSTEAVPF